MSSIQSGAPRMGDDAVTDPPPAMFPYSILLSYGNQLMTMILPGSWSGETPTGTDITMTATDNGDGTSAVQFCFKAGMPGDSIPATLTFTDSEGNETPYQLTLSVPTI